MSIIDSELIETVDSICVEVSSDFPLVAFLTEEVSEVILMDQSQLHPIPRTEDTFLGLILLRDKTIPVIDLFKSVSKLDSNENTEKIENTFSKLRLIIINYNNLQIAFKINSVIGYVPIFPVQEGVEKIAKNESDNDEMITEDEDSDLTEYHPDLKIKDLNYIKGQFSSADGIIDSERKILVLNLDEFLNVDLKGSSSRKSTTSTSDKIKIKSGKQEPVDEIDDEALDFSQYTLPDEE